MDAIENLTATTLRNIIGELELDESLTSREHINTKIRMVLDEATDPWGIKINRVEVKNITPPKDIQVAMEKQMRAERERREAILIAEGEKKSQVLIAEGRKGSRYPAGRSEKADGYQRGRRSVRGHPDDKQSYCGRTQAHQGRRSRRGRNQAQESGGVPEGCRRSGHKDNNTFGDTGSCRPCHFSQRIYKRINGKAARRIGRRLF